MQFLYGLLAAFWLMFGLVCVQSMQWQPAHPAPPFTLFELRDTDPEKIEKQIEVLLLSIAEERKTESEYSNSRLAHLHYLLGVQYWLKAFLQDSLRAQKVFIRFALEEYEQALDYYSNHYLALLRKADVFLVLGELDMAEEFYTMALNIARERQQPDLRTFDTIRTLERRLRDLVRYREGVGPMPQRSRSGVRSRSEEE